MGSWNSRCGTVFYHDRHLLRTVRNGRLSQFKVGEVATSPCHSNDRCDSNIQCRLLLRDQPSHQNERLLECRHGERNNEQSNRSKSLITNFQALQLPFATIPTIAFSSSKAIMGEFANGFINRVVSIMLSVVVIGINIYFVVSRVQEAELSAGWISLVGE